MAMKIRSNTSVVNVSKRLHCPFCQGDVRIGLCWADVAGDEAVQVQELVPVITHSLPHCHDFGDMDAEDYAAAVLQAQLN